MSFRINTNVTSLSARRTLGDNTRAQQDSMGKLSSGSRIVRSADDAAGLAISEKMRATIRGTKQAERNANDGVSLVQTAEGGLNEVSNLLIRLRELAIQSSTDTLGDEERAFTDMEYQSLKDEIGRIAEVTEFNGKKLLNGSGDKYDFQVGTKNDEFNDRISYDARNIDSSLESLDIANLSVASKEDAQSSLEKMDSALQTVSGQRAQLGAVQNRLTTTINNLKTYEENLSAANSRIRDTDYASETAKLARANILTTAGTSVLAQANASGMNALKLIG